jgi:hypothetical protein
MKTKAAGWIVVACCACALACTNDTGQPKSRGGVAGGIGVGGVGSFPPTGGRVGAAGIGGSPLVPVIPPPPTTPTTPPPLTVTAAECVKVASEASDGVVPFSCVQCTCALKPLQTEQCSADCWRLAACVINNCSPSDTTCIIERCAATVGGAANVGAVGSLTRQTPFMACLSECDFEDLSDSGPRNDI